MLYLWHNGKWVEAHRVPSPASTKAHVIHDITDMPFKSMADGKMYSSKKEYRANLRAHDMIEVGTEGPAAYGKKNVDHSGIREQIERAWDG